MLRRPPQDDDEPGILRFSQEYYEVVEGVDREVTLTVERTKGSSGLKRGRATASAEGCCRALEEA